MTYKKIYGFIHLAYTNPSEALIIKQKEHVSSVYRYADKN